MFELTHSRRSWLRNVTAAAISISASRARTFSHPLGVQLYTVRNIINKDPDAVLRRIAEIGYREVEVGRGELATLAPMLKKYNLKPVSCHIEAGYITGVYHWPVGLEPAERTQLERRRG
jgi:hypothetical protein